MGFFKKLFGIKEKDAVPEPEPEHHPKVEGRRDVQKECFYCKDIIGPERYSFTQGKYFHKKCLKKAKRSVMSGQYGG